MSKHKFQTEVNQLLHLIIHSAGPFSGDLKVHRHATSGQEEAQPQDGQKGSRAKVAGA